ncbi:MAG TPA: RagB/SusD family nutrient uptake outer membrane protein [Pedobacter sp.]|uniref:RagB/SusD family nutrient uptake outer membrane protein n=1 Tax=Pedobacter sp. TaxID=1411316 RepID=UPI002CC417E8|nr:RagB/SusD family nutrient uptake outer membrane protein [Pedobacter sp.]HMI01126.1 RagB/SusD family nutrient uptake outer membrane protein [Pedobacter sp.]
MKKFLYAILSLVLLTGAFSCKKYLELVPTGQLLLTKASDYRLLLDQVTKNGKSNGFYESYSKDAMMDDDITYNSYSITTYTNNDLAAFHFEDHLYSESEADLDWEALYNQIYVANLVVANVDASEGNDTEKHGLIAEARVHRAFAYFVLVNLYAKQYNPSTAATDPGVPIRKETDFEEKLVRKSVQEVYDYLRNELTLAVPDLPAVPNPQYGHRPVKPTALTLLARASLFMNHAQEAHDYANASLQAYSTLVDYNKLTPNSYFLDYQNTLVWEYPLHFKNPEVLMERTNINTQLLFISDDLKSQYDFTNDMRANTFFIDGKLYGIDYGYLNLLSSTPYKGPSVPETYLIRAEANARLGNTSSAIDDLNFLRKTRYKTGSDYTVAASNASDALALVKSERRRELTGCGLRYFDIKRYNVFDNANITITHTYEGTFTLAPNSPRVILPIGRKYIDLNAELIQNPR